MTRRDETLERVKNVLMILMCLAVIALVGRNLISPRTTSATSSLVPPAPYEKGESVGQLDGLPDADRVVLLALSSTCEFCTKSMGFYRSIAEQAGAVGRSHLKLVVYYFPSDTQVSIETYLATHRLKVDAVLPMPSNALDRISGTPNLIIIDRQQRAVGAWRGWLNPQREAEVLKVIG